MSVFEVILLGWVFLALIFSLLWEWQRRNRDAGIVDVGWAGGIGLLVVLYALLLEGYELRQWLLAICGLLWSVRLATFLYFGRLHKGEEEDPRYQYLRNHWGESAQPRFFVFFQAQAFADILLSLPIVLLMISPVRHLTIYDWLGVAMILFAVAMERLADRQLEAWKSDPSNKGKTCRRGLWKYSRHPNYFFEWFHWLAYPVMGIQLFGTGLAAWWPLTCVSAIVMLYLLLRGTGIPYTEKQAVRSRGDDYRRYQREVSAFVPWFPKHS